MPVKSIGGSRYFLTFTDDFSRKVTVMCVKSKEDVKLAYETTLHEQNAKAIGK